MELANISKELCDDGKLCNHKSLPSRCHPIGLGRLNTRGNLDLISTCAQLNRKGSIDRVVPLWRIPGGVSIHTKSPVVTNKPGELYFQSLMSIGNGYGCVPVSDSERWTIALSTETRQHLAKVPELAA